MSDNRRPLLKWIGGSLAGLLLLSCLITPLYVDILLNALFGWIPFLGKAASQLGVPWMGLATAALCVFLIVKLLRLLQPQLLPTGKQIHALLGLGGVLLAAIAGISVLGVVHQAAWLATSSEQLTAISLRGVRIRLLSMSNLREMALGASAYQQVHEVTPWAAPLETQGRGLHGWLTYLLPYVEQQGLYDQLRLDLPWLDSANADAVRTPVPEYLISDQPQRTAAGLGAANYAANAWLVKPSKPAGAEIRDGAGNTILAGEVVDGARAWANPANWRDPALGLNRGPQTFGGSTDSGVSFAFADGSVRVLSDEIDPAVLRALATPDGGEKIDPAKLDPYVDRLRGQRVQQ